MQNFIFKYLGIDFKLDLKSYMMLKSCISSHLETLLSENTNCKVDSLQLPIYSLNLIKWKFSISTMGSNTTITVFKNNKIFNNTTYSYDSLNYLFNTVF